MVKIFKWLNFMLYVFYKRKKTEVGRQGKRRRKKSSNGSQREDADSEQECKRESSAGGACEDPKAPRRRGGARQQHEKEAQQPVQPHWSTRGSSSLHCADGGGRHGHRTFIPATVSGPSLHQRQRGSPTPLPAPISTLARAKGTGPSAWGYFCITIFKSALLLQKNLKHKRKLKLVTLPPRNDPLHSGTRQHFQTREAELAASQCAARSMETRGGGTLTRRPLLEAGDKALGRSSLRPREGRRPYHQGLRDLDTQT